MKKRLSIIALLATLFLLFPLPVFSDGGSLGTITAITSSDTEGGGSFHFSFSPGFSYKKFSMTFNLLLKGTYTTDPFRLALDFSNYLIPEQEEGVSDWDYSMVLLKQYSAFIKTMHYGNRYDFFYFRYGKLDNITLGDGALLSSYFDNSVGFLESRPGLNLKLGPLGHFGFELVVDDIFVPTMIGARGYLMPFAVDDPQKERRINRMEWAYSFVFDPRTEADEEGDYSFRPLFLSSIEVAQPMFSGDAGQLTLFLDFLGQGEKDNILGGGKALRAGIWGRSKSLFLFNLSATTPIDGVYYSDYFTTGYNNPNSNEYDSSLGQLYPLHIGSVRLDGTLGMNWDSEQIYAGIRLRTNLSGEGFSGQRVLGTVRIDKLFRNFISLDVNYEKIYPTEGEGNMESFFPGLFTLNNVYLYGTVQLRVRGVEFDVTGTVKFDEYAQISYQWDLAVSMVFL